MNNLCTLLIFKYNILFLFSIILLKNTVAWYFQRKVNSNASKLKTIKKEKKDLLEKVMEKETYKVAVEILNRFGEKPTITRPPAPNATPRGQQLALAPRILPRSAPNSPINTNTQSRAILSANPNLQVRPISANNSNLNTTFNRNILQSTPSIPSHSTIQQQQLRTPIQIRNKRTPFPIIDFETKGVVEKMVDYIIGDGPSHRFAMVCRECHKHNGMALEEEYFFTPFQCVYCNTLNPARKLRPGAPTLPVINLSNKIIELRKSSSSSSTSSSSSDNETDCKPLHSTSSGSKETLIEKENIPSSSPVPVDENKENLSETDDKLESDVEIINDFGSEFDQVQSSQVGQVSNEDELQSNEIDNKGNKPDEEKKND